MLVGVVQMWELPYSGKTWRGINFGGLVNLSNGHQFKNSPMLYLIAAHVCLFLYVMYVMSLASRPDPQAGYHQNLYVGRQIFFI